MASLNAAPATPKKGHSMRPVIRVDMTPLVDLGFLLITFFVFTSTLSSSAATALVMPKEGPPMNTAESSTLTVLAGADNKVYAYSGGLQAASQNKQVHTSSYHVHTGVGALIREKQLQMMKKGIDKGELLLIIKASDGASYKNVVDLLDEVMINGVKRYAIAEPEAPEISFIAFR